MIPVGEMADWLRERLTNRGYQKSSVAIHHGDPVYVVIGNATAKLISCSVQDGKVYLIGDSAIE